MFCRFENNSKLANLVKSIFFVFFLFGSHGNQTSLKEFERELHHGQFVKFGEIRPAV